jgi:tetratricopeptide (TPR) repeat protein
MGIAELLKEGDVAFGKGDWASVSRIYGDVIRASIEIDDDLVLAMAYYRKGYADLRRADYEESVRHFMVALNISTAIDNIAMATDALRGLGAVHWQTGTYDMSADYYKEAMVRATELGDKALLGKVRIEYGNLVNFKGDLEGAIKEYKDAIELLHDAGDVAEESRAHNNLGDALFRLERYMDAIEEFKIAVHLGEDSCNFSRVAWARGNMALALIELGQVALARDNIILAKDFMERIGDRVGLGDIHEAMGLSFMMDGRYNNAEVELKAGLGVAMELDVPDRKAIAERNLGRFYIKIDERDKARLHLNRAMTLFDDIGMVSEARKVKAMLDGLETV